MPNAAGKKRERDVINPSSTSTSLPSAANSNNSSASGNVVVVPGDSPTTTASPTADALLGPAASTTNFRNVSACNRCRNRKNRCDQKLPKCTNCEKANVRCVGFDPVSKREIPRSYVYYLETRVNNLEAILDENNISYPPPSDDFAISDAIKPGINVPFPVQEEEGTAQAQSTMKQEAPEVRSALDPALKEQDEGARLDKLVNNIGMVSVQGASDSRFLGSTSGISFARVVFAAVKKSTSHTSTPSEKGGGRPQKTSSVDASGDGTTMRDSFFGLHSKPTIKPAPFPDKDLGHRLTELYFEHANPQIPVLHRGEFMALFDRVYATDAKKRTARELYMLNIVFAIGSGIIMDSSNIEQTMAATESSTQASEPPSKKRQRLASHQHQPEEYHSSAIIHLENFLGSSPAAEGVGGGLEELQAVLLLAGLALLRPVAPGLWYIIGVAVRLSIDLGLHFEDIDHELDSRPTHPTTGVAATNGAGRKQWTRDLRRRLWWCVFNLDRLVSSCVGRPVSISESVMTTELPSMLDDANITPAGFLKAPNLEEVPSYKLVSRHYIRLRLLQSEILQVLQHRQADSARQMGALHANSFVLAGLESPFMRRFRSFREWRAHIDLELLKWKETAPQPFHTGVAFNSLFLELNYWQAIIMLYRQSLSVPEPLASELSPATGDDIQSPGALNLEQEEDKQMVFLKVAQAGQTVLKIYRQLHRLKLVNYTFLATHHLFMSGISFLYAIWHSTLVRSQLTIDDVDFTVLAATSVLSDLMETCPPAGACRDAFMRMSKATISMVMSTTGFGNASTLGTQPLNSPGGYFSSIQSNNNSNPPQTSEMMPTSSASAASQSQFVKPRRPMPKFDMNLKDLFSEEEIASRPPTHQPKLQGLLLQPDQVHHHHSHLRQSHGNPLSSQNSIAIAASPEATFPSSSPLLQRNETIGSSHGDNTSSFTSVERNSPASYQQPFVAPAETGHAPSDFSFDNLDFLNDFIMTDPTINNHSNFWGSHPAADGSNTAGDDSTNTGIGTSGNGGDGMMMMDFNFFGTGSGSSGTGGGGAAGGGLGGGFDSSGAWEANGELFDSFFFGGGSGNTGYGS